jgi:glycosyltransferase involved in cell wall biosynthesis
MLTNRILGLSLACTLRPGAKSLMTFHSGGFPTTPEGMALGPNSFAGMVLRRFDGLIAVNAEIMGFFQKMRISPRRARIISPYSFLTDENSSPLPAPIAEFFAAHDPVLISAGQLEPEYDLRLQIEALSRLRDKFPRAGLLLLGSGSIEKDLLAQIEAQQCAPHVLLPGDVPHSATIEAMARSRILLRTTWYDGDAISVREAMQVGTPVIATDNSMRPAGVRLIPRSDVAALLRAIEEELQKPAPRKERTPADDSSVQQVLDFYQELLARKDTNAG